MFGQMGQSAYLWEAYPMAFNNHGFGIDARKFETDSGLKNMFKPTSVSYEPEGERRPFTTSMESEKYPLFGT